jgi:8-oxo-dGTP diphosphatase
MHHTAGGIVLDGQGRVLLVRHRKLGYWLQPGGSVEDGEDPAAAAIREIREETGIDAEPIGAVNFAHPTSRSVALPFAIVDRLSRLGTHRYLGFIYVCRPVGGTLTPQLAEVADARWVPIDGIGALGAVPDDLAELVAAAVRWAQAQR